MEYKEKNPLPDICQRCDKAREEWQNATDERKIELEKEYFFDCGECEYFDDRYEVPQIEKLRARRTAILNQMVLLNKELQTIDEVIDLIEG